MYGSKEFYYKDKLLKSGSKYPGIDMGTKILCVENKNWAWWLHYNFTSSFSFLSFFPSSFFQTDGGKCEKYKKRREQREKKKPEIDEEKAEENRGD